MNFRLRCHLAFLPLFLGLTLAAAGLAYVVEWRQITWGLTGQSEANALCLAEFIDVGAPESSAAPWARRQFIATRLGRNAGGLSICWFSPDGAGWRSRPLCAVPELRAPDLPDEAAVARLRTGLPVTLLRRRPEAPFDETVCYAGVHDPTGHLQAIIGVTGKDLVSRGERRRLWHTTLLLAAGALLASIVVAEILTRRVRRDLAELAHGAESLAHGDYGYGWKSSVVEELDDLSQTLRAIDRILQDNDRQMRRRFLRSAHQPTDAEIAVSCHHVSAADRGAPADQAPSCLVRRIHGSEPDDFWAVHRSHAGWHVLTGRLVAPPGISAVQRSVRADAARDYLCGLLDRTAPTNAMPELNAVFPLTRTVVASLVNGSADVGVESCGSVPAVLAPVQLSGRKFAAGVPVETTAPASAPRVVVLGTLEPRSLRVAREYLRHSPPGAIARAADELAALFTGHDRGLLIIFSLP